MEILNRLLFWGVALISSNIGAQAQLLDPELIFADYDADCSKHGVNIGLDPNITDWWFINVPCKNYNGSVGCETPDPLLPGKCRCNQGDSAYWDSNNKICWGKVGAFCTAEKTSLVAGKLCTPNADCVPVQSEGHNVGICQCLHGYKENDGTCIPDETVPEGDRATPRTTTTTEAPDRGPIKLPLLDLLFKINLVEYQGSCQGSLIPLLNRTHCDTNGATVACIDKKCKCNMGDDDTVFDEELNQCVGLVGTYCLTRSYLLGYKGCVAGADCFLEDETQSDQHSFGTCQCLYGYDPQNDGTCLRNTAITNPSTKRPGGPTPTTPTTTTPNPTTKGHASKNYMTSFNLVVFLSALYLLF